MKKLLERFNAIHGVRGYMVFDGTQAIVSTFSDDNFKEESMGLVLSNAYAGVRHFNITSATDQITYTYDNAVIFTKRITENLFLNVLCNKSVNLSNLAVSANVLVNEMTKVVNADDLKTSQEKSATRSNARLVTVEEVMGGPLGLIMENLKDQITYHVGAVSSFVLESCIEKWVANGAPQRSRIPELVKLLADEIDLADDRIDFITKAKRIMDNWM